MAKRDKVEEAGKESFPASDPPANSGIVGPQATPPHPPPSEDRGDAARPKGTPTDDRHRTETAYQREDERLPGSS